MFGTPYVWSHFLVQASDCDGGTTTPTAANWNASAIRKVTALWSSEAHFQKELQRALWEPERYIPNETKLGNNRAELSLIMGKCWNTYSIQTPLKILSEIPYIKSILMIKNGIIEYIKKGLNNKKRLMLGYCTNTTRNNASKDLCRQYWQCFHTWTGESESASERKLFQHEQTHCVHKLASANLSVWNYFTQAVPLKEIR